MPKIERTGIYRDANGHALFLRKDSIATDEVLADYALDADAELTEVQASIAAGERGNAPSGGREVESV